MTNWRKPRATLHGEIVSARSDMEKMETSLRAEMRALELRMTIKLGGLLVLALGLMTMLNRLFGPTATP